MHAALPFACAAGGKRHPCTSARAIAHRNPGSGIRIDAARLRGGRQGWAATPALPAGAAAPRNPDLMQTNIEHQVWMPVGRLMRQQKDISVSTTEASTDAIITRQASIAGGSGACYAPDGEREGQRPLAFLEANGIISFAPGEVELIDRVGCDLARRAAIRVHCPHLPERAAGRLVQVGDPLAIRRPDRVAMRARAGCQLRTVAAIRADHIDLSLRQVFCAGRAAHKRQPRAIGRPGRKLLFYISGVGQVARNIMRVQHE